MKTLARISLLLLTLTISFSVTEHIILAKDCYNEIQNWKPLRETPFRSTIGCIKIFKQYNRSI